MENFYILDLPLKYLFLPRNNNNIRYIDYVYESIKKNRVDRTGFL